jgi:3-hydroxyisobutyrate dehydrogenase-like beta-hydroxyacid dehydrogenase
MRKDLDPALELLHRCAADIPVTELVRELVDEAARTAADLDISAVITRYRRPAAAAGASGAPAAPRPR